MLQKTAKNSFLQSIAIYVIFMNIKKEQPPTRGWPVDKIAMPPCYLPKYKGGFCYVRLLTKRKHECKQCQKEYAKCQQLHKRNMNLMLSLFHSITPILWNLFLSSSRWWMLVLASFASFLQNPYTLPSGSSSLSPLAAFRDAEIRSLDLAPSL